MFDMAPRFDDYDFWTVHEAVTDEASVEITTSTAMLGVEQLNRSGLNGGSERDV